MRTYVGFGRTLAYGGRYDRLILTPTEVLDAIVYGPDAEPILYIKSLEEGGPVTEEGIEAWRKEMKDRFGSASDQLRQFVSEAPYHDTYPVVDDVLIDAAGRAWIGAYAGHDARRRTWVVFDKNGLPVGRLTIPSDNEVLDATLTHVLLLDHNSFDEERILIQVIEGQPH